MPLGIGEMTRLEKLYSFVAAENGPSLEPVAGLGELNGLNNMRGELIIRNFRYVIKDGVSEFRAANLEEKQYLQSLRLEWVIDPFSEPYSGAAFDSIVDNDDYYYKNDENDLKNENLALDVLRPHPNLQYLFLNIKHLPPFDHFNSLHILKIQELANLEYIDTDENSND
ncbi:hypothetical protein GH714_000726 [Hevea brasiliensis]|uniref:R13L1/DRL21-like LRR repeat region domain-containing protein n=1 Tax=Hevea brasiliensis TaxID=3981 RepID=A0A6A6KYX9_HEVBR|nr:hypothetical protein GH714_000726 [Hevea brasiliensis]